MNPLQRRLAIQEKPVGRQWGINRTYQHVGLLIIEARVVDGLFRLRTLPICRVAYQETRTVYKTLRLRTLPICRVAYPQTVSNAPTSLS